MAWISINQYRSSTSDGFGNTWTIYQCTARTRNRILREGLPVSDQQYLIADGTRRTYYSTMGIRLATRQEIARAKRDAREYGYPLVEWID